jgi:RNase adaptor protein for sRNA GlmZ degradation
MFYGALNFKYGFKEDQLLPIFQEYIDHFQLDNPYYIKILKPTDGISPDMLLYLAKKRTSHYMVLIAIKTYLLNIFLNIIIKNRFVLLLIMIIVI